MEMELFKSTNNKLKEENTSGFSMFLNNFILQIKEGNIKQIVEDDGFRIEEFLIKDKDNKNLIDYIFEYKIEIDDDLRDDLLSDYDVIKYLFDKKYINKDLVSKISNTKIIILCKQYNRFDLLKYVNEDVLLTKNDKNEFLLEEFFKYNQDELKEVLQRIGLHYHESVKAVCEKYNRSDLRNYYIEEHLFNNDALFETMIKSNKMTESFIFNTLNNHTEAINILKKYNKLDLLKSANINYLLKEYNHKTLLELLIDNNLFDENIIQNIKKYNFNNGDITREEANNKTVDILVKNKLYEYLIYFPRKLLEKYNNKKYYIDLFFESDNIEKNSILKSRYYTFSSAELAFLYYKCHINLASHLLPPITEERLLENRNGTRLIDELVKYDEDVEDIIPTNIKNKPTIKAILSLHGIEIDNKVIVVDDENFGHEERDKYYNLEVEETIETKLDALEEEFNDGVSDKDAVKTLIASYKYLAVTNYPYIYEELELLLDYKLMIGDLSIIKTKGKASFNKTNVCIKINNSMIDILNHELGHAIHYIASDYSVPDNFEEEADKIVKSPLTNIKLLELSKQCSAIRSKANREAQQIYDTKYKHSFDRKKKNELKTIIKTEKEELKKELVSLGYDSKTISVITDNMYNVPEKRYLEEYEKIKVKEIIMQFLYGKDNIYSAISDIMDAIMCGKIYDGNYKINNQAIRLGFGHGKEYFNDNKSRFTEIIANYSTIIKSEKRAEGLNLLRYLTSDSFIKMIDDAYKDMLNIKTKEIKL